MAINNLKSFRPKVLDTRGRAGVRREFRVIVENFASARKPEPEEETQEDAAKQVRYRGSSYSFTLRRPVRKFNLKATGEAEFSHEETDSDEVNVSIKLIHEPLEKTTGVNGIDLVPGPLEKTTGVPASEATEGNLHPPPVRTAACIPAGSSVGRRDILHDLLEPICRNHGRPLHDAFLGKIVAALDGKSIDAYRAALHAWLSKNSKKSGGWFAAGILLNLAQDVPREKPSRSPANPAPAGSVSEPENSGSLWMQIRQRVRTYVTEATYNNWFTATAFDRFDSQDDELHVCVADIAVKQSLEQEFASEIDRAIKILGLTVRRIVYRISLPGLAMEAVN
jgi:hypothetical protein